MEELEIGLFEPGMTHLHRLGLAGLYMALEHFNEEGWQPENGGWSFSPRKVRLQWSGSAANFFRQLFERSFAIDDSGLLDFASHRSARMGDIRKVVLSEAVRQTFLQHNKQNMIPKGTVERIKTISFDDTQRQIRYKPFGKTNAIMTAWTEMIGRNGLKDDVVIKSWLYPGAVVRHEAYNKENALTEPSGRYLCLAYASAACLFFRLSHRKKDGSWDKKMANAVVLPHLEDLEEYAHIFQRYLRAKPEKCTADGMADAGLSALILLTAEERVRRFPVSGFTVYTMGAVPWNKQQQRRTGMLSADIIPRTALETFGIAMRLLANRMVDKKVEGDQDSEDRGFFIAVSRVRGLAAENIACGKPWYLGFVDLVQNKDTWNLTAYEKEGICNMMQEMSWENSSEKHLVDALHISIRNIFGRLAEEARSRSESPENLWERERTKLRSGMVRAKNAQTLRAEVVDMLSRGNSNRVMQEKWQEITPLLNSDDWQRVRDLALLALVSYKGKGAPPVGDDTSGADSVEP